MSGERSIEQGSTGEVVLCEAAGGDVRIDVRLVNDSVWEATARSFGTSSASTSTPSCRSAIESTRAAGSI